LRIVLSNSSTSSETATLARTQLEKAALRIWPKKRKNDKQTRPTTTTTQQWIMETTQHRGKYDETNPRPRATTLSDDHDHGDN
jgi:hypothetical protein